ncbi:MAG: hypothetical protein ABL957_07925 [Parvularculaceae bacterium]
MAARDSGDARRGAGVTGGYLSSALIFAGITGLWAYVVREDPYYGTTQLLGLKLPVATVFYLTLMPLFGFAGGRWRYETAEAGSSFVAKFFARSVHFLYSHLLIALFTAAMISDYFFGFNIDENIKRIDDRMFDMASRFAPWLSAYLAGFNLGRAAAG